MFYPTSRISYIIRCSNYSRKGAFLSSYAPINVNRAPLVREILGDLTNLYAYVYKKDQIPTLPRTGEGGGAVDIDRYITPMWYHRYYGGTRNRMGLLY